MEGKEEIEKERKRTGERDREVKSQRRERERKRKREECPVNPPAVSFTRRVEANRSLGTRRTDGCSMAIQFNRVLFLKTTTTATAAAARKGGEEEESTDQEGCWSHAWLVGGGARPVCSLSPAMSFLLHRSRCA